MSPSKPDSLARRAIVDEYGDLQTALAPWRQKQARLEELAKIIRSWYADADAQVGASESGERFEAGLSAKKLSTSINILGVFKALGKKKFLEVASVTLKALESALPAAVLATLTTKERTGSRDLLVSPKKVDEKEQKAA